MPRRLNSRLAKSHRSYTIEEIAETFQVHKNSVRRWIASGLPVIDAQRPLLVHGRDLSQFLAGRRREAKQPCRPGQIYCVACRSPKHPAGDMAECLPSTSTSANLCGICPDCDRYIYRRVNLAGLDLVRGRLDVTFKQAGPRIGGIATPSHKCDFNRGDGA
jgi:hypothetical protein